MRRGLVGGIIGLLMVAALTPIHFFVAALPLTTATPLILLDHVWRLGLLAVLLWLATAIGLTIADRLRITFATPVEALPFSVALGWGAMMTIMVWLGLVHLFNLVAIMIGLLVLAFLAWREWGRAGGVWRAIAVAIIRVLRGPGLTFVQVAVAMIGGLLFVAAIPTLAPVDAYDALMYHLSAPVAFIEAGRILPFPQQVQPNYPLGFEMLYAIGLMLKTDRLAQMLHFSSVVLLGLAVYAFGRRFWGRLTGLLAVLILLASPKVTLIGGWAFTDMAFVFFATLALYALVRWWRTDIWGWLFLSGIMGGLGLSLKYYGFRPVLALGLALLWREVQLRRGWRRLLVDALSFGGVALALAAPWYIKNWLWLDNPIFPFFLGGVNWNTYRAEEWSRWVDTFGRGQTLMDYLLLPVRVWFYPADFSATPHGYFNPGLLLAMVALFLKPPRLLIGLWVYIVAQFFLWAVMMQELRYLLLILPWLSLCAGWTLAYLFEITRSYRWLGALTRTAPLVLLAIPLAIHIGVLTPFSRNPGPTILGLEPPANYLRRVNYIYDSMEVINNQLPLEAQVIFLWEGQTYYCQRACLADPIYDRWGDWVYRYQTIDRVLSQIQTLGATHLLVNHEGLKPLLRDRSPAGPRAKHIAAFYSFRDQYLAELYTDRFVTLYQINYPQ
ncbi:MAG: glycosyltransferase family 39 protein [Anaerolineae bacterium]|nr:glycosyltransferase family 39 protein [Anaerolineae bacterium]